MERHEEIVAKDEVIALLLTPSRELAMQIM